METKNKSKLKYTLITITVLSIAQCTTGQSNCQQSIANAPPGICPTWHWYQQTANTSQCNCGGSQYTSIYISQCSHTPVLNRDYCVTLNNNMTYLGLCPYDSLYGSNPQVSITNDSLKLNEQICSPLNRTGILCSECQPGLGPAVFSYYRECKECVPNHLGWLLFFLRFMLPLSVFCILVIVFRINIVSPALNGFILSVQLITNGFNNYPFVIRGMERSYSITKFVADVYGIFSLDFFTYAVPSFCIREEMSMLTVLSLQYIEALYPIVVVWFLYICIVLHDKGYRIMIIVWRPFHKCLARFRNSWQIKGSVMNAFTTFLILSYCKICSISLYLAQPVTVWDVCGGNTNNVYYDASIRAFSKKHIPYLALASCFTLFFLLLPALFILFYQNKLFQKCLDKCRFRCLLIHEMANTTQGCFKNGTEPGTRDCRWFAGFYLILRMLLVFFINQQYNELIYVVAPTIVALMVLGLRPYRVEWCNIIDAIFWMTFSVSTSWRLYWTAFNAAWQDMPYVLKLIPLVYIMCYIVYLMYNMCKARYTSRQSQINENEEEIPHRMIYPNEYEQLLQKSS